jgi:hypothetical protein
VVSVGTCMHQHIETGTLQHPVAMIACDLSETLTTAHGNPGRKEAQSCSAFRIRFGQTAPATLMQ